MQNEVKRAILNAVADLKGYVDITFRKDSVWVDSEFVSVVHIVEKDGTSEFTVITQTKRGGYKHGEDIWPLEKIVDCLNEAVKLANEERNNVEY